MQVRRYNIVESGELHQAMSRLTAHLQK